MNYLFPNSRTALGASDAQEVDLIRIWASIKTQMFRGQGGYQARDDQGQLVYLTAPGSSAFQPHITAAQAKAIHDSMLKFADRMRKQMVSDGRDAWSLSHAILSYIGEYGKIAPGLQDTYRPEGGGGPYLSLVSADKFFKITGLFARDANTGIWAGYNIGTSYENFKWALDETHGGWLIKSFLVTGEAVVATYEWGKENIPGLLNDVLGGFGGLLKWGTIAGIGYVAYLIVKKTDARRRA